MAAPPVYLGVVGIYYSFPRSPSSGRVGGAIDRLLVRYCFHSVALFDKRGSSHSRRF
jgi:hypothetical protein